MNSYQNSPGMDKDGGLEIWVGPSVQSYSSYEPSSSTTDDSQDADEFDFNPVSVK